MEQMNIGVVVIIALVTGFIGLITYAIYLIGTFMQKHYVSPKVQRYSGRLMEVTKVTELKPGSTHHLHPEEYAELERDIKGQAPTELIPGQKPYDREKSLIDAKNRHDQHAARVRAVWEQQNNYKIDSFRYCDKCGGGFIQLDDNNVSGLCVSCNVKAIEESNKATREYLDSLDNSNEV